MFEKLLQTIKERRLGSMKRQTEQLDGPTLVNLSEFLSDVPDEVTEVQLVQDELEDLHHRLVQSMDKEAFVGKRLASYEHQLTQYQLRKQQQQQQQQSEATATGTTTITSSATATDDTAQDKQRDNDDDSEYQKHCQLLHQIKLSHKTLQRAIQVLQEQIQHLEHKHAQLLHKTEECQAVYDTTQALVVGTTTATRTTITTTTSTTIPPDPQPDLEPGVHPPSYPHHDLVIELVPTKTAQPPPLTEEPDSQPIEVPTANDHGSERGESSNATTNLPAVVKSNVQPSDDIEIAQ